MPPVGFDPKISAGERPQVKPEVATAAIELLMMGGKTPETC